ncbi:hypothetical protein [Rhizobium sp. CF142]|uniref:hypothetical protein n=1 Tax=Rhizobium sp. CF142 TaxID=1144314 RepID=UPI0012F66415|nr:hypothetical protein [Rhizobium sp. CF142]
MGAKASTAIENADIEIPTTSALWVDVPPSCLTVKAIFPTYPSEDVIREIKDHCLDKGTPYTWRGHTHTAPPKDGKMPIYVGRIEISADARKRKEFSPCPCCTPNHRKFGEGLIAWFEDEQVIRLMGKDCFAAINRVGHEDAYADLVRRENERRQLDYILSIIDKLPHWVRSGDELLTIAKAADAFYPVIEDRIVKSQGVSNFWREIRGGALHVDEEVVKFSVGRDGYEAGSDDKDDDGEEKKQPTESIRVAILGIEGQAAMDPKRRPIYPPLSEAVEGLKKTRTTTRDEVLALSPNDRQTIARELKRFLDLITKARDDLRQQLPFLTQINVNRLNQWAGDPRSPVSRSSFSIRRWNNKLYIGGRRGDYPFDIPDELTSLLLPELDA